MRYRAKRLGWDETPVSLVTARDVLDPYDFDSDELEGELIQRTVQSEGIDTYTQYLVDGQPADPNTLVKVTDYANGSRKLSDPVTVTSSGGAPMTTTAEPVSLDKDDEDLGGKPSSGTPADKRLKKNSKAKSSTPSSEGDTETLADGPTEDLTPEGTIAPDALPVMHETPQWRGVLVVEGEPTGDGREFGNDSITWAVPPLPFRWQKVDSHGGMPTNETVRVGTIQRVWRDGTNIMGEGVFDLSGPDDDFAHTAYRAMQSGALTGVSIDADDITDADIEYVFPDNPDEEQEDDLFMLLFAQPEKIIFHAARVRAATLCDIPAFVEARITMIPEAEQASLSAGGYLAVNEPPPPFGTNHPDALVAHAWHDEWRPPKAWFSDPKLGQVMPIVVTEQGRVYGHAAQWGQCHLGYKDECVTPPFEDFHAYFLTGEVIADDGGHVAVGQITAGIEHAPLTYRANAAKEHYENTDAVVCDVTLGNDAHGIWVAGAVRPSTQSARVQALRASGQVSPDWRRIGGALRLVGLLTVNVSGYQTARARSFVASGEIQSLVSSGMIVVRNEPPTTMSDDELTALAYRKLREQLNDRVHGKGV
jgi:hypothetical protein